MSTLLNASNFLIFPKQLIVKFSSNNEIISTEFTLNFSRTMTVIVIELNSKIPQKTLSHSLPAQRNNSQFSLSEKFSSAEICKCHISCIIYLFIITFFWSTTFWCHLRNDMKVIEFRLRSGKNFFHCARLGWTCEWQNSEWLIGNVLNFKSDFVGIDISLGILKWMG